MDVGGGVWLWRRKRRGCLWIFFFFLRINEQVSDESLHRLTKDGILIFVESFFKLESIST